ncbi:MAG: DsbA family protein [Brevirhabdus sp.]
MVSRNVMFGAIGAVAIAVGGWLVLNPQSSSIPAAGIGAVNAQTALAEVDTSAVFEVALGQEDAPITMIEYASFTCPHCANFHTGALQDIKKEYIDTGKVKLIHREVYFDRYGLWAGMVARCAGPDRYFPMIDLVYKGQRELFSSSDPNAVVENLRKLGRTAGLSDEQLDACTTDADMAQALVAYYQKNADADKIEATPSFIINGEKYDNMSIANFREVLDGLLGE